MAKKPRPGDKERLARARALAELAEVPTGPRMMAELANAPQDAGTTVEWTGNRATGYGEAGKTNYGVLDYDRGMVRHATRDAAGQAWRKTPVPVDPKNIYDKNAASINLDHGMRGVNQMKTGMDVGKLAFDVAHGRPGRDLDAVNRKITEEARLRLDPNNVQDALERLSREDVVAGGPNLDPGETMPTGAYGQMRREDAARTRATDTGKVQYVAPPPGSRDIARWMHPRTQPELVETVSPGEGKGGRAIPMSPQDAAAYRKAASGVEAIRGQIKAAEADLRKTGDEELAKTVIPELKRSEQAAIAGLKTLAGEIQKRPASAQGTKADYPFALSEVEKSIMRDKGLLQDQQAGMGGEAVRGPEAFAGWDQQAAQVEELARKGYRQQATKLARQLMGRATIYDWLPDRWAQNIGPQLMGYMREAMKSNSRVDPISLFQNIRQKLQATVTGELPRGISQQRMQDRQDQAAELAGQREQRIADAGLDREDRAEQRQVQADEEKKATARVKSIEVQVKQEEAEYKQRASETDQLKAKLPLAEDGEKADLKARIKANSDRMQQLDTYIRGLRKQMIDEYDRQAGGAATQPGQLPTVTTREQFDALESGATYLTKDGRKARKP